MKHAMPLMLERGGGSIINTSSIAGLEAGWGPLAYSTAKAAVTHMSRCAAAELSPKKIRVNTLCPGLIATPMFGKELGMSGKAADDLAQLVAKNAAGVQPIPKAGVPADIAAAALYLASDESRFVSGIQIVVDGALTVGGRHAWDTATPSPFTAIPGVNLEAMQALMRGTGA
jgi:NAD(P)-dependent dehydrogenase (short-subunit alcohol dehydrogenase family)